MKKKLILFVAPFLLSGCLGVSIIDSGHRGVHKNFGKVSTQVLDEGLHLYNPFTSDIIEMNVQEQKFEGETQTYTKDTQKVTITFTLSLNPTPEKMAEFYQKFGTNWSSKLIPQVVLGGIKDVIGKINADDLNGARDRTAHLISGDIKTKLAEVDIFVRNFEMTNIKFESGYEHAVEAKVIATQKAIEAQNRTVEVTENAKQNIIAAKADAESMKIRSQALSQNKSLIEYEAVQKWDGKLPRIMMGGKSSPFIHLDGQGQKD